MKIYLVRHGDSMLAESDDARPLSEKGKRDVQSLANAIFPLRPYVFQIWQSPKLRAQQTAEILVPSFLFNGNLETREDLSPNASVNNIVRQLSEINENLLLVGHMPFMGKLASKLLVGSENKEIIVFQTATMVCLEKIAYDQWIINWVINPTLFSSS